jgi:hypothetical protein
MQAALDSSSGRTVVFRARTDWLTRPLHITRNHSRLLFEPGAVVTAKSGAFKGVQPWAAGSFSSFRARHSGAAYMQHEYVLY